MAPQQQQAVNDVVSHALDSSLNTSWENTPVTSDCDSPRDPPPAPFSPVKPSPPSPPSATANLLANVVAVLGSPSVLNPTEGPQSRVLPITLGEGSANIRTFQFAPFKATPPQSMKPAAAPDSSKLNALSSSSSLHGSMSSGGSSMAGSMTRRSLVSINRERNNRNSSSSALFSRRGSSGSSSVSSSRRGNLSGALGAPHPSMQVKSPTQQDSSAASAAAAVSPTLGAVAGSWSEGEGSDWEAAAFKVTQGAVQGDGWTSSDSEGEYGAGVRIARRADKSVLWANPELMMNNAFKALKSIEKEVRRGGGGGGGTGVRRGVGGWGRGGGVGWGGGGVEEGVDEGGKEYLLHGWDRET